ncbi:MAG: triose-phosphate isomerase [Patescibacteria group bacterium]
MSGKIARKIIVGNWKMNPLSLKEAEKLFIDITKHISGIKKTEIVICPPFLYLERLKKISLRDNSAGEAKKIFIGAQDAFYEERGAFTGEISAEMLSNTGIKYVILGHSERRALGEKNTDVNKKIKASLSLGLAPIVCFGENVRDENHEYLNFVKIQIEEGLNGISKNLISKIIIAYEPIWAIGKDATREATPEEFREMSIFIRKILSDKFGAKTVEKLRIIYGGSAHPENVFGFLQEGQAEGFLLGRDSLDPKKFLEIIETTENAIN